MIRVRRVDFSTGTGSRARSPFQSIQLALLKRSHTLIDIRTPTLLIAFLMSSCATTPGSHPHEMSSAQHEAAAKAEERVAAGHDAQYVPNAAAPKEKCSPRSGPSLRTGFDPEVCWTSVVNPTDVHRRVADEHRRHAADHRGGSSALRDAEARACVGITPDDRDISPFEHKEDIATVEPLNVGAGGAKQPSMRLVGATVTFRAVQGMTTEWLQRVIECHVARNAALGHVVPEMPNCPLVPNGVEAHVTSSGNDFAVAIRSNDMPVAQEILARARRLLEDKATSKTRSQ